jgi:alpha-beta hydrolase superfamily lysophospholipase
MNAASLPPRAYALLSALWHARRGLWRLALALLTALLLVLGWRAWATLHGPPLMPWHRHVPAETPARQIDRLDWAGYVAAEQALFDRTAEWLSEHLPPGADVPSSRYAPSSPMHPSRRAVDWNRSYRLAPEGPPHGVAVLLHGLTDSPYSLRHLARHYQMRGYLALVIRLPGHGTVPGALTRVDWQDWRAAVRLALRQARADVPAPAPLHLVGYSNGGALALQYALDTIDDPALPRPQQLVLLSPMIGVTSLARFAGVLGWPALFPAFDRAAWVDIYPEYNPYKYNSFPINAGRQASQLTRQLQQQMQAAIDAGRIGGLPPLLAFQSLADATVSTPAVISELFARLPANGSELVLIDIDRSMLVDTLLRSEALPAPAQLLPPPPRAFAVSVLSNLGVASGELVEETTPAGAMQGTRRHLGLRYPFGVYSLSHIALPFPLSDGLYGLNPDPDDVPGLPLGALSVRGERGLLWVSQDDLARIKCNPFFDDLLQRIDTLLQRPASPP